MDDLIYLLRKLRAPGGCPWDRAQTSQSLAPFFLEEAYELLEAIQEADDARIREELGDLLLHILFQAHLAEERGAFSWDDVVRGITGKISSRHAHILSEPVAVENRDRVPETWETAKLAEEGRQSLLDGIPTSLPALLRAWRCQQRAAEVGFDWPDAASVWDKVHEELAELKNAVASSDQVEIAAEFGDLLFALVSYGRHLGIVAEEALHAGIGRFASRFRAMEELLDQRGIPLGAASLEQMDAVWEEIKTRERNAQGASNRETSQSEDSRQE
jgi:tetrapyrrole methylase family protein/MazG family protein